MNRQYQLRVVQRPACQGAALFILVLALVLAGVSCISVPPSSPSDDPSVDGLVPASPSDSARPSGPDQALLDETQKALARVEEARKRAIDFESPAYFPSEWETAEEGRAQADALPKTTDAGARSAAAALNAVADAYDDLFNKTIALYAQAREDEIIDARDALITGGLVDAFSRYLREADETALAALDQYEAKDYYTARDTAAGALEKYQVLEIAARAWLARKEIMDKGFDSYDPAGVDRADALCLAAVDAYDSGDIDTSRNYAEDALDRYNQTLMAAWSAYAVDMADAARKARQNALDVKADVAVKAAFNDAEEFYNRAASALNSAHWKEAAVLYPEAETRFTAAGNAAIEKRRIAGDAIREAEQRAQATDEAARQAEIILQGGSL